MLQAHWVLRSLLLLLALTFVSGKASVAQDTPQAGTALGSQAAVDNRAQDFQHLISKIKDAKARLTEAKANAGDVDGGRFALARAIFGDDFIPFLQSAPVKPLQSFLSEIEESRIDKQVGGGGGNAGSTSLVSKGSVPSLLGFAVENGALASSTSGTTITFRGRPTGILNALVKQNYLQSGPLALSATGQPLPSETWYKLLYRLSFSVSFDATRGSTPATFTGSSQQVSAYSFRYDIINHRDPRDSKYVTQWFKLASDSQTNFATKLTFLSAKIAQTSAYTTWIQGAEKALEDASDKDVEAVFLDQVDKFKAQILALPELQIELRAAIDAGNQFAQERIATIERAGKSPIVEFEYSVTKQPPMTSTMGAPLTTATAPDIGTFKLIGEGHFLGNSEITANFAATIFNSIPTGSTAGRLRDIQFSTQIDTPLPEISGIGKPTLSFSGLFLSLREEPLGTPIMVNGVPISTKGNIGFGQAKIEFKAKGTGVKMPISITYASRTELIKESDIRASIGVTFDLDQLFAKPR